LTRMTTDPVTAPPLRNGHAAPRHALHGTSEYLQLQSQLGRHRKDKDREEIRAR
jgi:hypothetical protein